MHYFNLNNKKQTDSFRISWKRYLYASATGFFYLLAVGVFAKLIKLLGALFLNGLQHVRHYNPFFSFVSKNRRRDTIPMFRTQLPRANWS